MKNTLPCLKRTLILVFLSLIFNGSVSSPRHHHLGDRQPGILIRSWKGTGYAPYDYDYTNQTRTVPDVKVSDLIAAGVTVAHIEEICFDVSP